MSVWIVMDGDYDTDWVAAVYTRKNLADAHVAALGGYVSESQVLDALHSDAIDPAKLEARAQAVRDHASDQLRYEEHMRHRREAAEAARPHTHMMLCKCQTFMKRGWTDHGYCDYCGGFSPAVFLAYKGREAIDMAIDDLSVHDRIRMQAIVDAL